jgi:hypothetical protein
MLSLDVHASGRACLQACHSPPTIWVPHPSRLCLSRWVGIGEADRTHPKPPPRIETAALHIRLAIHGPWRLERAAGPHHNSPGRQAWVCERDGIEGCRPETRLDLTAHLI